MNLNQYQHLSASPVQHTLAPALDLQRFGEGMGAFGLPGDCSSPSRYIRAAFYRLNSRCEDQEHSRVAQFFRLLDTVAMPRGSVITEQGREDITIYSCCMSKATQTYYCKTYESAGICAVSMRPEMMDDKQLHIYDLCQQWSPIFIPEQRA